MPLMRPDHLGSVALNMDVGAWFPRLHRRGLRSATLAAVKTTQLPGVERLFHFVEGEALVPNRLRYIGLSV